MVSRDALILIFGVVGGLILLGWFYRLVYRIKPSRKMSEMEAHRRIARIQPELPSNPTTSMREAWERPPPDYIPPPYPPPAHHRVVESSRSPV
ncbi:hypothetical protein T439DRAFT_328430 [Meredithblackwellia eburnea MCA 4105]